ncbi:acyl-CoA synthetase (AMP-forming)/AMP-acid ligase II [Nocardia tenerifensis]|uniref:Acyl-CoA synthetase (AMP-forming)/AMP-acid ligase II n=1 Tax=Nocardia tenerifensis TaxID=228006 RepID=A0A318JSW8_9NOCA|nr:AMP-binding protein [Nocardia tenerifensis]PXX54602.1 acyl-CoA synthetase (AMP-forming)/AMP-acid ligase II [Nocardia tenerifensis]
MTLRALRLAPAEPVIWEGEQPVPADAVRSGIRSAEAWLDTADKALVAVATGRTLPGLLAYLTALRHGHAVLLAEDLARGRLLDTYRPERVLDDGTEPVPAGYRSGGSFLGARMLVRSNPSEDGIHPELALLMTTSGSSGQPKAVRLSYTNVAANAEAIAEALGLHAADIGITSLPMDYSFGLSIVNSHLRVGAGLVLSPSSPTSRRFWRLAERAGVTNIGAVPVSYRLLRQLDWRASAHRSLRLAYQAGGALEPELVEHFGRMLAAHGGGFCPMYGATEATARMTYLPPESLLDHLGSVGRPVPGGRLRIDGPDRGVGEIVYEGPNVMLGYAHSRADLSEGDTTGGILRTGDLGYLDRGMLYCVGRKDRRIKLHGKRILLDDVERRLTRVGPAAAVPATGEAAVVYVEGHVEPFREAWLTTLRALELPAECLPLRAVARLPRTGAGKVDLVRLRTMAAAE